MKVTGRPIGQQIRDVVAIVSEQGASNYRQVQLPSVDQININKIMSRAVGLGLMTTDRTQRPRTFTAVPDWQDRLDHHHTTRLALPTKPRAIRAHRPMINSVWALAA